MRKGTRGKTGNRGQSMSSAGSSGGHNGQRRGSGHNGQAHGSQPVRYAVVGLGHIAQVAVLPAFAHAKKNSVLAALVSDDPDKLNTLGKRYGVDKLYSYDEYDRCLRSGEIDAVYIALPNSMHEEFSVQAAEAGVHVLCEKPLAVTDRECWAIVRACEEAGVRLMTAYRLHFEVANLEAVKLCQSGKLGEIRLFNSTFTMQVKDPDNIRLRAEMGGGPLHDIGIYCINAARSVFQDDPREVIAWAEDHGDSRFKEVPGSVTAMMRYDRGRMATFTCSFGAADVSTYQVVGTEGDVRLDPAYEYAEALKLHITIDGKTKSVQHKRRDQFGAELVYFSECVQEGREPEPSGLEGAADVRIIRAMQWSIETGRTAHLPPMRRQEQPPHHSQRMDLPPVGRVRTVKARSPSEN